MRSNAPTTKCCNTRLSQPSRVGLASPALLCRLKELLLSSVIVGEQALDINLVDGVEAVVFIGHARAGTFTWKRALLMFSASCFMVCGQRPMLRKQERQIKVQWAWHYTFFSDSECVTHASDELEEIVFDMLSAFGRCMLTCKEQRTLTSLQPST